MKWCDLSPQLFNIIIVGCCDGNWLVIKSVFGFSVSVVSNLRFADISLLADSDLDLQSLVDKVNKTSGRFGLQISSSKTEVQVIGRDTAQSVIHVKLDNNELKQLRALCTWVAQSVATLLVIKTLHTGWA